MFIWNSCLIFTDIHEYIKRPKTTKDYFPYAVLCSFTYFLFVGGVAYPSSWSVLAIKP